MERNRPCPLCYFRTEDERKLTRHILRKHKGESCFRVQCEFQGCKYTGTSWNAYKQHLRRKHDLTVAQLEAEIDEVPDDNDDLVPPPRDEEEIDTCDDQKMLAKFLLNLEARHKVSSSAVDNVLVSSEKLLSQVKNAWLKKILSVEGVEDFREEIEKAIKDSDGTGKESSFNELRSAQRRKTYYRENFMFVSPQKVLLGSKYIEAKGGRLKLSNKFAHIIPLQEQLEKLLLLADIAKFVQEDRTSKSERMNDVCDGEYLRSHTLQGTEEIFLQIVLSYDDLELQNPLRSNKTHKLAMFYFSLLNIPPQYRSQLHNIFLVAIGRTVDVKHFGLSKVLQDFLETLKKLRYEGIEMCVGGDIKVVRGDLVFAVCDTPAAALLGGFKESSMALKCCRMCKASAAEMKEVLVPKDFELRDRVSYEEQCTALENPLLAKQRSHWSKMYGVNSRSVLDRLKSFPVTENLIQDPMHCLLEGVCGQEIALMLNYIVFDHALVSLNWVNGKLQAFPYDALDAPNRPNPIEKKHITAPAMFVKQKASSILTLSYILPLILGELFQDEEMDPHYKNFLRCMKITCIAFSPYADKTLAGVLEQLSVSYCREFCNLYPDTSFKPKMHFLLHLPRQMLLFGPLRLQNTFRFEGKHGWFKDFRWNNFINLPRSLSYKHQLLLANNMTDDMGCPSRSFVQKGDCIQEGTVLTSAQIEDSIISALPECLLGEDSLYFCKEAVVDSLKYSVGGAIVVEEDEFSFPIFGRIEHVACSSDNRKFVVLQKLRTLGFEELFNAYFVEEEDKKIVCEIASLQNKWPLPIYSVCEKMLITNRFSLFAIAH